MRARISAIWLLTASLALALMPAATSAFDDTEITRVTYPAWFKQTFYDLGDDLSDAEAAGKQGILVFFTTQGCSYCTLMLQETFADPVLAERLQRAFDVVGLEMFDDSTITDWQGETLRIKEFAVREGAQFSPTLVFYDARGKRLLRLVGYYDPERFGRALDYLEQGPPAGLSFRAWLERQQEVVEAAGSVVLMDDPLFAKPPYQLDRRRVAAERPLLVIFERRRCPDCIRFHREVLSAPEVREQLARFEVVRLDAQDRTTTVVTPAGRATTPADWWTDLGLTQMPGLVWFDERGGRVLKTDALVLKGRMLNALGFVSDRAYEKGWTYQRYARSEGLRRSNGTGQ